MSNSEVKIYTYTRMYLAAFLSILFKNTTSLSRLEKSWPQKSFPEPLTREMSMISDKGVLNLTKSAALTVWQSERRRPVLFFNVLFIFFVWIFFTAFLSFRSTNDVQLTFVSGYNNTKYLWKNTWDHRGRSHKYFLSFFCFFHTYVQWNMYP